MAIVKWDPETLFTRLWRWPFDSEELLEWPEVTATTGIDVYETENEIVVKAPMPGVKPKDVEVTFEDGVLRMKAKVEETEEEKKAKKAVYRKQRIASFDYTTTLPRAIEAEKIDANLADGVLTVKAPIAASAKPRKITVKTK